MNIIKIIRKYSDWIILTKAEDVEKRGIVIRRPY